jgi:hexokinase
MRALYINSLCSRKQAFEKMVSGMYLGEIVRNILIHLIDLSMLFEGYSSAEMNSHYGLDTAIVSGIEATKDDQEVKKILVKDMSLPSEHISDSDVEIVRWACRLVAKRASDLAACAMAAVIKHTENDKVHEGDTDMGVDIGIDGRYVVFLATVSILR